ncbi:MAG: hypothetical protein CVU61_02055 [Deltaproteobacteria bacterium HGW-Deltaproteobacteria-19]|nr:MAG: hypothetical protein CVU61_02055 [Deltaproteobacteria bacterium HGW-Deltaproteobacteria-19]
MEPLSGSAMQKKVVTLPLGQKTNGDMTPLPEIRCLRCHRLLMKGRIRKVEIKCPKCGCILFLSETACYSVP